MQWEIKAKIKAKSPSARRKEIIDKILENRGIKTKTDKKTFLNPPKPETITSKKAGINNDQLQKALKRTLKAINNGEKIVIYGDYDADGICATAILWETLFALGANVTPFIPRRGEHGYGLSIAGLEEVIAKDNPELIITVDNGIIAHKEAEFVAKKGIDLIITDHHVRTKTLPKALSLIHTTQLAGSGVAWMFAKEIVKKAGNKSFNINSTLDLATIGTVADLVSLKNINRSLVKWGIERLKQTKRPGLKAIFVEAGIDSKSIDTYHISFMIGPRLNAMGRLEHAMDSLRLLCTKNSQRANRLASILSETNQARQELTSVLVEKAFALVDDPHKKLLIVDHEDFHEGVIGLVAGKIVEKHYRPALVISKSETVSKASARSVSGVNIIELIRKKENLLINAGGHPMAAGFTIETDKIEQFKNELSEVAEQHISQDDLQPKLQIDCKINLRDISWKLHKQIEKLKPFGIGNPRPRFALQQIKPLEILRIGQQGKHLKILLPSEIKAQSTISGLWFNKGEIYGQLPENISLAFSINENVWKQKRELQLIIKHITSPKDHYS